MRGALFVLVLASSAFAQDPAQGADSTQPPEASNGRIFWIIPNFRSSPTLAEYKPLTPKAKFRIAAQDSFDRGTIALGALFGAEAQLTSANPSFGQGVRGYARYFGSSYGDFLIGDMMTEGVMPTLLHQDPRYFRRGTGSRMGRLGYSIGQIFLTHNDSGRTAFNFSEIGGNAGAVAISNAYYRDNQTVSNAVSKLGTQIGVDMVSNVLKEFWPDISQKLTRHHKE